MNDETTVLLKSARRCALCFGLNGDLDEKTGQIAHLDRDASDGREENLVWLCMRHHSHYDSKTSQHKNYTLREVRAAREKLYEAIAGRKHVEAAARAATPGRNAPGAYVELAITESVPGVVALCYNLGDNPLVADELILSVQGGTRRHSQLAGPSLVAPGTFMQAEVDCSEFVTSTAQEASVVFRLKGPAGTVITEPVWFYFYAEAGAPYGWRPGRLADRQPGAIMPEPRLVPKIAK